MNGRSGQTERRAQRRTRVKECRLAFYVYRLFTWRKPDMGKPVVMLDISHGGVAFVHSDYLQPGAKLVMTLGFAGDKNLYSARGVVCYSKRMEETGMYRVGVQFTERDEKLDHAIKFLAERFV